MRIYSADQSEEVVNLITAPMAGNEVEDGRASQSEDALLDTSTTDNPRTLSTASRPGSS